MMTIRELESELKAYPGDWHVSFAPLPLGWGGVHSYRGYYDEPACGYKVGVRSTVAEVLADLRKLVTEEFTGWKGGEFRYAQDDVLHVACAGDTTTAFISSVSSPFSGYVNLVIVHVDDD